MVLMSRNLTIIVAVAVLAIAGYFLFIQNQKQQAPTPSTQTTMPSETPTATSEATTTSEMREITVDGNEFSFTPASLSLMAGEKIKLTFNNKGKFPHNLTIDELGVATKTTKPGETDGIEFTVSKTGNFEMYCGVGNHRAQGMEGTVDVK